MKTICVIPARGGSKEIPKKNIIDFLGKPLIAYSIEQARSSHLISDVYVSSDCDLILKTSEKYGAIPVTRPTEISDDISTSESALLHTFQHLKDKHIDFDVCVFLQATSPIRETFDINNAIEVLKHKKCDSVFSASLLEDFLVWEKTKTGLKSINYDYKNRTRRQDSKKIQFLENGSIYVFKKNSFLNSKNRLHGSIEVSLMQSWKSFEIDTLQDLEICKEIYKNKLL